MSVSWIAPIDSEPDYYRVYGYNGANRVLLAQTSATYVSVAEGHGKYGVVSVLDGAESDPVYASCVRVQMDNQPPFVHPDISNCP